MISNGYTGGLTFVLRGWYRPGDDCPLLHPCAVENCHLPAAFHLCSTHAFPGQIVESETEGKKFVIGMWLVQRKGERHFILLNDRDLGVLFGDREAFEKQLVSQGYTVLQFLSQENEVERLKSVYPGLYARPWVP